MDASAYFRGKRVTVMGLGLLGGVHDIAYIAESGADIVATDLKKEDSLQPSLEILKKFSNIRYTLGRHDLKDFTNRDLIIKAPGTPADSPYIAEAHKNGIEVTMWSALFARFSRDVGAKIIGITGTRGKTTVTEMISAILQLAGKQVIVGGNVQGTSLLPQLKNLTSESIAVLELDSWKLQGWGEAKMSPNIAVFTTFYADHLNYYAGNMDVYLADKANIFLNQTNTGVLVLGTQAAPIVTNIYAGHISSRVIVSPELPNGWKLRVPGKHNRYNAALALTAAREIGITDDISRRALEFFAGVPGRLELIRIVNSVKIYNDTTSTTPEATLAALYALGGARTILIMGGFDKELDMRALIEQLKEFKKVILLDGSGTNRILQDLLARSDIAIYGPYGGLIAAVEKAFELAESGDNILFSPAFASFGMFKNEYDRGDKFNAVVRNL